MATQRVLVTGGTGFLGAHLCARLRETGAEVHATSRQHRDKLPNGPTWWKVDMADAASARSHFDAIKPEIVFHLAGSVGAKPDIDRIVPTFSSLLTSTVNILLAATQVGCNRIVITGSLTEPIGPAGEPTPTSPYAAAKWAAVAYGRMFNRLYGTPVVIVRPFMTFGPAQAPTKLIPSVILSSLTGRNPELASGEWKADWIYVADVIEGLISAAIAPNIEGKTFDLGTGVLTSTRSVVERLIEILGVNVVPRFGTLPDRPAEHETRANINVTAEELGWTPTTTLTAGFQQTIEWYRRYSKLLKIC